MSSNIIKLSSSVRIRKEHFGGILFNTNTGDVIEVDREAFNLITMIKDIGIVDVRALAGLSLSNRGNKAKHTLSTLMALGIINEMPDGVLSDNYKKALEEKNKIESNWPMCQHLSAPETVHWAVTYRCDNNCPDCYIERHKRLITNELDIQDATTLIDKIAQRGVFQIAIGGGEPLTRGDLEDIVRMAWGKGLVVHLTTGKYEIEEKRLAKLAKCLKTLQIGIRTDELLRQGGGVPEKLRELAAKLAEYKVVTGANIVMSHSSINNLDKIVELLKSSGIKRYTLLRYKPPGNVKRWLQEKPDKHDMYLLEDRLALLQERNPDIRLRIDCAFSFLERRLNPHIALHAGIRGCVAFGRILAIAPDGSVYPCSQLVGTAFNAGNLLYKDFNAIWNESIVARKYRYFRGHKSFIEGSCGKCKARTFCGGCRVFADDAIGSDPGCPEPLCGNEKEAGTWREGDSYPSWIYELR